MDARNAAKWIVVILVVVGCSPLVFAGPVYIYGGDFNLPIPSPDDPWSEYGKGHMADAIIEIPVSFIIHDIDVEVALTHGSLFDLELILQSPIGTNVVLNPAGNLAFIVRGKDGRLGPVGGSGKWLFDDEAEVSIEEATEPFFGPFRPVQNLSSFDGENAFGPWRLQIYDYWCAHTGTLNRFELMIETPEPATATLLLLATGLITLFKPRRT